MKIIAHQKKFFVMKQISHRCQKYVTCQKYITCKVYFTCQKYVTFEIKKLTKFLTQKSSQNVNKNVKNILLISYK